MKQKNVTIRQKNSTLSPSEPVGETVSSVTVPDLSISTPATMQEVEKLIKRSLHNHVGWTQCRLRATLARFALTRVSLARFTLATIILTRF